MKSNAAIADTNYTSHQEIIETDSTDLKEAHKKEQQSSSSLFDVLKKIIDLSDDAWNAMKSVLPGNVAEQVGPFLVGAVGIIVHFREGLEGLKQFREAYRNKEIGQPKTRLLISFLTIMFAGTGVGLGTSLIAGAAGAVVSGIVLFPILICGFLTGIYSVALWRRSYILYCAQVAEIEAEHQYKNIEKNCNHLELLLKSHEFKLHQYDKEIEPILLKKQHHEDLSKDEYNIFNKYNEIKQTINSYQSEYIVAKNRMKEQQKKCEFLSEKRLQAEREVAFGAIEVTGSVLVLIGTVLGTAALIGASIASMGMFPFGIIVTGVALGLVSKFIENRDEKNNYAYSRGIKSWFQSKWNQFTNRFFSTPQLINKLNSEKSDQSERSISKKSNTSQLLKAVGYNHNHTMSFTLSRQSFLKTPLSSESEKQIFNSNSENKMEHSKMVSTSFSDRSTSRFV